MMDLSVELTVVVIVDGYRVEREENVGNKPCVASDDDECP